MIKLLKEYEELTPQMKANMDKCLQNLDMPIMTFKEFARVNFEGARMGLNAIIQIGDHPLMIEGVDGDIPDTTGMEQINIYPKYNPNEKHDE